jgi:hypothetical protein
MTDTKTCQIRSSIADVTLALSTGRAIVSCIRATEGSKIGWVSDSYHKRQASTCIRLELDINGDTSIESQLALR